MTQILYNLRTSDLGYRITKFTDGEVESSYLTSDQACDCPAGHRYTCRHRQMLPEMLARHLADSDLFWDFDRGFSCDINGNAKRETITITDEFGTIDPKVWDACAPAEQDTEAYGTAPFILMGALDELKAENEAKRARLAAAEQTVRASSAWRRL